MIAFLPIIATFAISRDYASDRDDRVPQRWQTQFGIPAATEDAAENALDQLSAEMDRVLQRRYQFEASQVPTLEEIKQSNKEIERIFGEINKARVLK